MNVLPIMRMISHLNIAYWEKGSQEDIIQSIHNEGFLKFDNLLTKNLLAKKATKEKESMILNHNEKYDAKHRIFWNRNILQ